MRAYRARLRAAGLRPVQIWVPDVRAPNFVEEARRQSLRASRHPSEKNAIDFIEAVAELDDDAS
ncbi:antitoxin MazE family protein [Defluviicoccus vanus]|uniref:Antitoxin MazE family protein n=2 Tax=Defluviicoccus vanus TaxID=111831 RepID=A0A7H1N5R4_9PROT|nr:antitoxin MazE family protein [Defluviicoccus vanus]